LVNFLCYNFYVKFFVREFFVKAIVTYKNSMNETLLLTFLNQFSNQPGHKQVYFIDMTLKAICIVQTKTIMPFLCLILDLFDSQDSELAEAAFSKVQFSILV